MKKNFCIFCFAALFSVFAMAGFIGQALAADEAVISLPSPKKTGGKPLMDALAARSGDGNISSRFLSFETISSLLWATWGINRTDGRRTAPTGRNLQQINVYVVLESGVYLYDAAKNQLIQKVKQDVRSKYPSAGLTLLYAVPADSRFGKMEIGSLYQNAALFCASENLLNRVRYQGIDALKDILPLPKGYKVEITQSVGYSK
jgi:hypothetical protein